MAAAKPAVSPAAAALAVQNRQVRANSVVSCQHSAGSAGFMPPGILQRANLPPAGAADAAVLPRSLTSWGIGERQRLRVAHPGSEGAFGETVAVKAFPECEPLACGPRFDAVFRCVEHGIADRAVVPVETSFGGAVHRSLDLLVSHRLHIVGEVLLPILPSLLAFPGEKNPTFLPLNDEQLCETRGSPSGLLPVNREEFVHGEEEADELDEFHGLGEEPAAQHDDVARYLMLGREPVVPPAVTSAGPCPAQAFKTSIAFTLQRAAAVAEGSGCGAVLIKVLSAFAFRGIGISKLETRPQKSSRTSNGKVEQVYHVDLEVSTADERAQNALMAIQEFTSYLRVLGSYPIDSLLTP